ncbi:MAG: formylglycine-generating enzyme family protein [Pseudomonadota bacterium]
MPRNSAARPRRALPAAERERRKRYLFATLVLCVVLAMIGGTLHVVELGSLRMADMRAKATYDLSEEHARIKAAGEMAMTLAARGQSGVAAYTSEEAGGLLTAEQWKEVESTVVIPAGAFLMGTDSVQSNDENRPQHRVELPAYRIDKYPVTNAQYARFVAATGHRPPSYWENGKIPAGQELHPVTLVSWYDAKAYAEWAGKRLPSEAEWEKAARGTDGRRWPWGDAMDPRRLNTYYNVGATTPVTAYPKGASPYGVMDMAGNVSEWTADEFLPYAGTDAPQDLFKAKAGVVSSAADRSLKVIDLITTEARYKVMRGGSWKSDPFSTATYHRNYSLPHYASDFYGFRCAQNVK